MLLQIKVRMDARFAFRNCQVNLKNDIPSMITEPLYVVSAEMSVVMNSKKHEKLQQGQELEAVIKFGKKDDSINTKCVEVELADIRKKKASVLENNYKNALSKIARMKEELLLKEAHEERVARLFRNQQNLMIQISQALVHVKEYRERMLHQVGDFSRSLDHLEADWQMVITMDTLSDERLKRDPTGPVKQMRRMLQHMVAMMDGAPVYHNNP